VRHKGLRREILSRQTKIQRSLDYLLWFIKHRITGYFVKVLFISLMSHPEQVWCLYNAAFVTLVLSNGKDHYSEIYQL